MEMTIADKLQFLSRAKDFTVTALKTGDYDISFVDGSNVCAEMNTIGDVTYYVNGVYNSGTDYAEIEIDKLHELMNFCSLLNGSYDLL